jgi:hypothetical protein
MQICRGRFGKSMTTTTQHVKAAYEALDKALGRLLDAGDENIAFLEEALSHRDQVLAGLEWLEIGKYSLRAASPGKIWISCPDGEGGEFDMAKLEKVIGEFYDKEF